MHLTNLPQNKRRLVPSLRLLIVSLAIVFVWGWMLPWAADRDHVKRRLEFLDQQGIDASAMFYTELDVMDRILDKQERRH